MRTSGVRYEDSQMAKIFDNLLNDLSSLKTKYKNSSQELGFEKLIAFERIIITVHTIIMPTFSNNNPTPNIKTMILKNGSTLNTFKNNISLFRAPKFSFFKAAEKVMFSLTREANKQFEHLDASERSSKIAEYIINGLNAHIEEFGNTINRVHVNHYLPEFQDLIRQNPPIFDPKASADDENNPKKLMNIEQFIVRTMANYEEAFFSEFDAHAQHSLVIDNPIMMDLGLTIGNAFLTAPVELQELISFFNPNALVLDFSNTSFLTAALKKLVHFAPKITLENAANFSYTLTRFFDNFSEKEPINGQELYPAIKAETLIRFIKNIGEYLGNNPQLDQNQDDFLSFANKVYQNPEVASFPLFKKYIETGNLLNEYNTFVNTNFSDIPAQTDSLTIIKLCSEKLAKAQELVTQKIPFLTHQLNADGRYSVTGITSPVQAFEDIITRLKIIKTRAEERQRELLEQQDAIISTNLSNFSQTLATIEETLETIQKSPPEDYKTILANVENDLQSFIQQAKPESAYLDIIQRANLVQLKLPKILKDLEQAEVMGTLDIEKLKSRLKSKEDEISLLLNTTTSRLVVEASKPLKKSHGRRASFSGKPFVKEENETELASPNIVRLSTINQLNTTIRMLERLLNGHPPVLPLLKTKKSKIEFESIDTLINQLSSYGTLEGLLTRHEQQQLVAATKNYKEAQRSFLPKLTDQDFQDYVKRLRNGIKRIHTEQNNLLANESSELQNQYIQELKAPSAKPIQQEQKKEDKVANIFKLQKECNALKAIIHLYEKIVDFNLEKKRLGEKSYFDTTDNELKLNEGIRNDISKLKTSLKNIEADFLLISKNNDQQFSNLHMALGELIKPLSEDIFTVENELASNAVTLLNNYHTQEIDDFITNSLRTCLQKSDISPNEYTSPVSNKIIENFEALVARLPEEVIPTTLNETQTALINRITNFKKILEINQTMASIIFNESKQNAVNNSNLIKGLTLPLPLEEKLSDKLTNIGETLENLKSIQEKIDTRIKTRDEQSTRWKAELNEYALKKSPERQAFINSLNQEIDNYKESGDFQPLLTKIDSGLNDFPGVNLKIILNGIATDVVDLSREVPKDYFNEEKPLVISDVNNLSNYSESYKKTINALYQSITKMEAHGAFLQKKDPKAANTTVVLASDLKKDVDRFIQQNKDTSTMPAEFDKFKREFSYRLHSQDKVMNKHRHEWSPIVARIAACLTGIGAVILAAKAVHTKLTKGYFGTFFKETNRRKIVGEMDEQLKNSPSNSPGNQK